MTVESFDAAWLALREEADHRSRADALVAIVAEWWSDRSCSRVLDLGSGTGSNLRYLSRRLPSPQVWTLVDHDADLLGRVGSGPTGVTIECIQSDLFDEGLGRVERSDLVTASALLDLVSAAWLDRLADACAAARCGALFALTYDGRFEWESREHEAGPSDVTRTSREDPDHGFVRSAINEHQRRDKGLGPALGPTAAQAAREAFRRRGFETWARPTPWRLRRRDAELARAVLSGWKAAALEQRPAAADRIGAWADRLSRATRADFTLTVGHVDLLALPALDVDE